MLSGSQIKAMGLIKTDFVESSLRGASYDLRVETFYRKDDAPRSNGAEEEVWIEPQGIVGVISKEIISLPHDVCAHATVKNSLSVEGILAINIGVIDPGWEGPIASVLLNFGKDRYRLTKGSVFVRLSFHKVSEPMALPDGLKRYSREEYTVKSRSNFDAFMAKSFMDFEKTAEKTSKKYSEDLKTSLFKYLPVAALMLTLLTFFLNFGVLSIASRAMPQDEVQLRAESLVNTRTADLREQVMALKEEIQKLKSELEKTKLPKTK